jgi:alpha-ribazole phosphatase
MEIHLIRHTTPDIEKGICYGQADVPLKISFEEEANKVLESLPEGIQIIYTSPLIRCLRLAEFLSSRLLIPIIVDSRLKELNFGKWEMKRWKEIEPTSLQEWMDDYVNQRCPEGESYTELFSRAKVFLIDLKLTAYDNVAILTHHGIIKCIDSYFHDSNLKMGMEKKVAFGQIVRYVYS